MDIVTITLWVIIVIFSVGVSMWFILFALGLRYDEPTHVWEATDIQVRVMTVGENAGVIQRTVDATIEHFDDVRVISEQSVDIDGATVHVVPESFDSEATRKGRAHDWAVEHLSHDREYNLYLDEDTIITNFDGIPDTDIVQFFEIPQYSGSLFSFLTEVTRVGYQHEMYAFPKLTYPLYLWGGAFAVRTSIENKVGWKRDTITEDTAFLWELVNAGATYSITRQSYENQAPPSIRALISQRRRWLAGTREILYTLPVLWKAIVVVRGVMWVSSVLTLYTVIVSLAFVSLPLVIGVPMFLILVAWSILGARKYDTPVRLLLLTLLFFPIIHTINAAGVTYGALRPPEDFEVTEKK